MLVGLAVLVGLPGAAAAAGWWAVGGFAVAALLAWLSAGTGRDGGARESAEGGYGRAVAGMRGVAATACLALCAATFGAYAVPRSPAIAALAVLLVVALADLAGLRLTAAVRRWLVIALLVAGLGLIAVSVAIPPAPTADSVPPSAVGLPLAAAVLTPFFAGQRRARSLVVVTATGMAVAVAVLYQLGPVRLGLSPTAIRDLLAAADAEALGVLLTLAVVLATVPAALWCAGAARTRFGFAGETVGTRAPGAAIGVLAAGAGALLLPPFDLLTIAAATALLALVGGNLLRLKESGFAGARRPLAGTLLGLVCLAVIPPLPLVIALVLSGAAALAGRYRVPRD